MKNSIILLLLSTQSFWAQILINGTVKDNDGKVLFNVNVTEKGTFNSTTSDVEGRFKISVNKEAVLVFSYVGFKSREEKVSNGSEMTIVLNETNVLDEVLIVGRRNTNTSKSDGLLPIDFIKLEEIKTQYGTKELTDLLQNASPSFNANKQSGSDGADHVVPTSLRGLGPDQTLILINGKRRYQSSLVNLFGIRGKGNTGTDLNVIPIAAIKRIEILKDGAAAQYGSDAIAGVINIVLKDNVDEVNGSIMYGGYNTNAKGDFLPGTPNTKGYRLDENGNGNSFGKDKILDGLSTKLSLNYGVALKESGGFINLTTDFFTKEKTLRPSYAFRKGFGEAAVDNFSLAMNMNLPISNSTEFYMFGIQGYRETDAYAFTRRGGARVVTSIYPGGYTPRITSNIIDNSICVGLKTKLESDWTLDFSQNYGRNIFHYHIKGTLNASLEDASPTEFDAGGHSISQSTTNVDFYKRINSSFRPLNISFGGEFRTERFKIFSGEEGSYATYDVNGNVVTDSSTQTIPIDSVSGNPRPGGSQGFPGYSPQNEVDKSRYNASAYFDGEIECSAKTLVGFAARYEKYSDFGSSLNGKLVAKIKLFDNLDLRGSIGTCFRAPSLAQLYFNLKYTNFNSSGAYEILLSSNDDPVTRAFGIQKLNQERSTNLSLGLIAKYKNGHASIDFYNVKVKDRIVLTGYFDASFLNMGVSSAEFFANGVNTTTNGVDLSFYYKMRQGVANIEFSLNGNFNSMKIDKINSGTLDELVFFGRKERAALQASAPKSKINLNITYNRAKFYSMVSFIHYSKVILIDSGGDDDIYQPRLVTDLTAGFQISKKIRFALGSNNIFNVYPTKQDETGSTFGGGYWDAVQMGYNGAYYYTRLEFKI